MLCIGAAPRFESCAAWSMFIPGFRGGWVPALRKLRSIIALSVGVHVARAVAVVVAVDFADSYVVGCERVVFGS